MKIGVIHATANAVAPLMEEFGKAEEPVQQLKGFEKVTLRPGEEKRIKIRLEESTEGMEIRIGSSSRDTRLTIRP